LTLLSALVVLVVAVELALQETETMGFLVEKPV